MQCDLLGFDSELRDWIYPCSKRRSLSTLSKSHRETSLDITSILCHPWRDMECKSRRLAVQPQYEYFIITFLLRELVRPKYNTQQNAVTQFEIDVWVSSVRCGWVNVGLWGVPKIHVITLKARVSAHKEEIFLSKYKSLNASSLSCNLFCFGKWRVKKSVNQSTAECLFTN